MVHKGGTRRSARTCKTLKPRKEKKANPCYDENRPSDTVTISVFAEQGSCKKEDGSKEDDSCVGCSTPKAERYKIPVIGTCLPVPKKRRRRCWKRPRSFFVSPDIEAFFLHALGGISVK